MTASSRRLIELSFLALLDSGIDYRGRKVGSFAAGTNMEASAYVRRLRILCFGLTLRGSDVPVVLGPSRLP